MSITRIGIVLVAMAVGCAGGACACVGSRPLAMGGAFIGLADDANATYWNPAGLTQIEPASITGTWMHTSTKRDRINYQEFSSMATCIQASHLGKRLAFGISYIKDDTSVFAGGTTIPDTQEWYWASFALDTGKLGMFGINVRRIQDSASGFSIKTDIGLDGSWFYRVDPQLTVGVLVQDANAPEMKIGGIGSLYRVRNYRAGLAFRPSPNTVITFDGYDIANNAGAQSARAGIEMRRGSVALRAGYFGIESSLDNGATFGIGITKRNYTLDATVLTGDFDNAILLSGTFEVL
jgi:hypothetical protein